MKAQWMCSKRFSFNFVIKIIDNIWYIVIYIKIALMLI